MGIASIQASLSLWYVHSLSSKGHLYYNRNELLTFREQYVLKPAFTEPTLLCDQYFETVNGNGNKM